MANVKEYRQIVQKLIEEIHSYSSSNTEIEEEIVFDRDRDRYLLIDLGWHQKEYVYETIIHIDIKDEKIWIQRNNTEINLADRLVENGVSKENIVIGLHSPFMRQFSGCAVG
jgi:XisI protein